MDFKKYIEADRENLIRDIMALVAVNSVEAEPKEGMPFGEGPAKALELFLEIAEKMGFRVENFDNYAGHVDYDPVCGGAKESVGILGHVDVVPAGDGWICDPFQPKLIDGKLYGRGVLDNKGPMLVCLHALKILKEMGIPLNRRIRIICGANEETDERCMHHYFGTLKMTPPTVSFTPDAEFPVKYGEKGVFQYEIITDISEEIDITGGSVVNAVPDHAQVRLDVSYKERLEKSLEDMKKLTGCEYVITEETNTVLLEAIGKAAHAMNPAAGINAITGIMAAVNAVGAAGELGRIAAFYMDRIGTAIHAENLHAELHDEESGSISFNVGKVRTEDGKLIFSVDNRVPISFTCTDAEEAIRKGLEGTGFHLENPSKTEKIYMDPDSYLVRTLTEVYRDVAGDRESVPVIDGGCTYARECPNCVAFGALLPGQPDLMHAKNEYVEVDKLDTWMEIYLETIYRLAQ